MWRPDDWKNPHLRKHSSNISPTECGCWYCGEWRAYEAGADAMYEELMTRYKVKMPPDFKSILLIIPEEEE